MSSPPVEAQIEKDTTIYRAWAQQNRQTEDARVTTIATASHPNGAGGFDRPLFRHGDEPVFPIPKSAHGRDMTGITGYLSPGRWFHRY